MVNHNANFNFLIQNAADRLVKSDCRISTDEAKPTGGSSAAETMLTVLRRSLLIRGFINTEFAADHYDSFVKELSPLIRSDDIRYREDISEGLPRPCPKVTHIRPLDRDGGALPWRILYNGMLRRGSYFTGTKQGACPRSI